MYLKVECYTGGRCAINISPCFLCLKKSYCLSVLGSIPFPWFTLELSVYLLGFSLSPQLSESPCPLSLLKTCLIDSLRLSLLSLTLLLLRILNSQEKQSYCFLSPFRTGEAIEWQSGGVLALVRPSVD